MRKPETFLESQRRMGGPFWVLILLRRALFMIPAHVLRALFCLTIFLGWGIKDFLAAWEATR